MNRKADELCARRVKVSEMGGHVCQWWRPAVSEAPVTSTQTLYSPSRGNTYISYHPSKARGITPFSDHRQVHTHQRWRGIITRPDSERPIFYTGGENMQGNQTADLGFESFHDLGAWLGSPAHQCFRKIAGDGTDQRLPSQSI